MQKGAGAMSEAGQLNGRGLTRGQCLRSLAAGSTLLPGLLSELLAEDSGVPGTVRGIGRAHV